MPEVILFYTPNSHLSYWLATDCSLLLSCIWQSPLPGCCPVLAVCWLEAGVRQCAPRFIKRIVSLWNYVFHVPEYTCSMKIIPRWEIYYHVNLLVAATSIIVTASHQRRSGSKNDLKSDNRGHAIQWDATSCSAYHDLVPIYLFLPPLLYGSFGGLLHTEQQMFFSWYYMQIFQAAAQCWYYHMRNPMTLTFLAVPNLLYCLPFEPKNFQLYVKKYVFLFLLLSL